MSILHFDRLGERDKAIDKKDHRPVRVWGSGACLLGGSTYPRIAAPDGSSPTDRVWRAHSTLPSPGNSSAIVVVVVVVVVVGWMMMM